MADPRFDTVCLSGPRGLGKTFLAAKVLEQCLTPGHPMHQPGMEYILGAASLEQARLTYQFIWHALSDNKEYRWSDSTTRLGATHEPSHTKLRAISSKASTSLGLVGVPLACLDEPGALELAGGAALSDSLFTAQGKPGSKLKLILIGTLGPNATGPGHWWYDLIDEGTTGTTWVRKFQGDLETWDSWATIRRANPLAMVDAGFRAKLLSERDSARHDPRLKARFLTYRLNIPSATESQMLLTVDDWQQTTARPVPPRVGKPVVALDLASGRSWAAATAMWQNGRAESLAVAAGVPDLETQERRDRVNPGTYQRLVSEGKLRVAEGLRVQPPAMLAEAIVNQWGVPATIICDRFRLAELADAAPRLKITPRRTRWSESAEDIRALRAAAKDGPLAVSECSRDLLAASIAVTTIKNDDQGSFRIIKRNLGCRDDVAQTLCWAAGEHARRTRKPAGGAFLGV